MPYVRHCRGTEIVRWAIACIFTRRNQGGSESDIGHGELTEQKTLRQSVANRSRMETINMYQYVRAREGLARAQSVLPPPPRNGKRCRASPDADTSAKKRQRQGPAETPTALPRTRPGGSFYNGKGTVVRTLQLQHDTTPIGSCLQFPWGALSLQPPPPLIIRGTSVAEVLHHPLP